MRHAPSAQGALDALTKLEKALKFLRLYPRAHPFCSGAIEECAQAIAHYHDGHGPLALDLRRDGVYLDEALLQAASSEPGDLAGMLYPEGVRSLVLDEGLDAAELSELLDALAGAAPDDEDAPLERDLLGALWRGSFPHVQYGVYDELSPGAVKAGRQDPFLAPVARRIAELASAIAPSGAGEAADLDAFLERAGGSSLPGGPKPGSSLPGGPKPGSSLPGGPKPGPPGPPGSAGEAAASTVPEAAREYLASEAGADRRAFLAALSDPLLGDNVGRAADVVAWLGANEDEDEDEDEPGAGGGGAAGGSGLRPQDVAAFFTTGVAHALWQGHIEQATELLARAEALDAPTAQAVTAALSTPGSVATLADALQRRCPTLAPAEREALGTRYLARLGRAAVPAAARVFAGAALLDDEVRSVFRRLLAAHAADSPDALVPLTMHRDDRLVRDAIALLVGAGRGTAAWAAVERLVEDPAHPRRAIVRDVADELTGARACRAMLAAAADGTEKNERLAAVRGLRTSKSAQQAFEGLAGVARDARFAKRDQDEVEAVLEALVKLDGAAAAPVLEELAGRKSLLFGRKDTEKVAAAASRWLGKLRGGAP